MRVENLDFVRTNRSTGPSLRRRVPGRVVRGTKTLWFGFSDRATTGPQTVRSPSRLSLAAGLKKKRGRSARRFQPYPTSRYRRADRCLTRNQPRVARFRRGGWRVNPTPNWSYRTGYRLPWPMLASMREVDRRSGFRPRNGPTISIGTQPRLDTVERIAISLWSALLGLLSGADPDPILPQIPSQIPFPCTPKKSEKKFLPSLRGFCAFCAFFVESSDRFGNPGIGHLV